MPDGSLPSREQIEAGAHLYAQLLAKPLAQKIRSGDVTLISIGPQCATASVLRTLNLRFAAYPFDWVFSSLPMVEHCFRDRFRTFLDDAYYRPGPNGSTEHTYYRGMFGVDRVFNHHQMPDRLYLYQKRVRRLMEAQNPVFIYIARDEPTGRELSKVRSALPGPLLAFVVRKDGDAGGVQDCGGFTTLWAYDDIGPGGFFSAADEIAFAAHLTRAYGGAKGRDRIAPPPVSDQALRIRIQLPASDPSPVPATPI